MNTDDKKYLADISEEISRQTGFRNEDVYEVVKRVFPTMINYMLKDKAVVITNFGRFHLWKRPPRVVYSARNQRYTTTDYKAIIKFKQSVRFGERLAILSNPDYDWGEDNSVEDE